MAAGPLRNGAIAVAAREALATGEVRCHAFPLSDSVGTFDCIRQLQAAGLAVEVHPTPQRTGAPELQR